MYKSNHQSISILKSKRGETSIEVARLGGILQAKTRRKSRMTKLRQGLHFLIIGA